MNGRFQLKSTHADWILLSGLLALLLGCQQPKESATSAKPRARVEQLFEDPTGELVDESWETHYVRGAKMGHRHRQSFRLSFPGADEETLMQLVTTDYLEMRRFGSVVKQQLKSVSVESVDGTVKQLGYRVTAGSGASAAVGEVVDGVLKLERSDGIQTTSANLKWNPSIGGIFAIEKSLVSQPMQPGEERSVQAFLPLVDRVVTYDLIAKVEESTELGDDARQLLRVEATDRGGDKSLKIPTVRWVDDRGTILKTTEAFLSRETRRTDESEATRSNELYRIDFGIDTGVPLKEPIQQPESLTYAVYRVTIDGLDPKDVFPESEGQRVLPAEPGVALLTVSRVLPDDPAKLELNSTPPTDDDLAPNRLIQSDHPRVKALARAVVSDSAADDPWRIATSLQRYIFSSLKKNDFSQVFSGAGEVAKRKQGDCSEHAVLLAAACRSRGVPARVAIGLIYSGKEQSFLYHMWNEIWVKDRWVPLDATRRESGTSAVYLKMRDSNLANQSAFDVVSPIVHVMDRIQVESISTQP